MQSTTWPPCMYYAPNGIEICRRQSISSSETSHMSSNPVYLLEIFNWRKICISTNPLLICNTQHEPSLSRMYKPIQSSFLEGHHLRRRSQWESREIMVPGVTQLLAISPQPSTNCGLWE